MRNSSPWLSRDGYDSHAVQWFVKYCLESHYDVPEAAAELRFRRGWTQESLRHDPDAEFNDLHTITKHRDTELDDRDLDMLMSFTEWFGTKPAWIWVEWR